MDDILKRMLAVEQEGQSLVQEAQAKADKIAQESLLRVNEITQEGQKKLSEEVAKLQADAAAAADAEWKRRLAEAERVLQEDKNAFRSRIEGALSKIEDALLHTGNQECH